MLEIPLIGKCPATYPVEEMGRETSESKMALFGWMRFYGTFYFYGQSNTVVRAIGDVVYSRNMTLESGLHRKITRKQQN